VIENVAVFNEDNIAEAKLFCLAFSAWETLEYLHGCIAQKCMAAASSAIDRRNFVAGGARMRR
jgi:hypothetical protein